jgi:glycolate oxidase
MSTSEPASTQKKSIEDETLHCPRCTTPEAIRRIKAIGAAHGLSIVIFGHAGDGNLHPTILFDRRDPQQWAKVEPMVGEIFDVALELEGTLSGEHGVGILKRPYMEQALGPISIEVQRRIKQALDPRDTMNPGKVLPSRHPRASIQEQGGQK